mmetsp:Transcript_9032/g.19426  ORF Transcript_9032/g.19426 Transcript_9032/m.19426 type:complete len:269 (+) Transcript_9032:417-1223(+)
MQSRGWYVNGLNRSVEGLRAEKPLPSQISSGVNSRSGLKTSASEPQSFGLRCLSQLVTWTKVPSGTLTFSPSSPWIQSSCSSCRKVPLATAGHKRSVSMMHRVMNCSRERSPYSMLRPLRKTKNSSTSCCRRIWTSGFFASSYSSHVIVWPVVSWPANAKIKAFPSLVRESSSGVVVWITRLSGPWSMRPASTSSGAAWSGSPDNLMSVSINPRINLPSAGAPAKASRKRLFVWSMNSSGTPIIPNISCASASCSRKSDMSTTGPSST